MRRSNGRGTHGYNSKAKRTSKKLKWRDFSSSDEERDYLFAEHNQLPLKPIDHSMSPIFLKKEYYLEEGPDRSEFESNQLIFKPNTGSNSISALGVVKSEEVLSAHYSHGGGEDRLSELARSFHDDQAFVSFDQEDSKFLVNSGRSYHTSRM